MITNDEILKKLKATIQNSLPDAEVGIAWGGFAEDRPESPYAPFLLTVMATTFDGLHEGARQRIVWDILLGGEFSEDELRRIEFVFTDAPSDIIAANHEA